MANQDFGVNQALVEDQYRRYRENALSVDDEWRRFFEGLSPEDRWSLESAGGALPAGRGDTDSYRVHHAELAWKVSRMVTAFRTRGHIYAKWDPLGLQQLEPHELAPEAFGLTDAEMEVEVQTDLAGLERATPRQILEVMRARWCSTVGAEVMQVEDPVERAWLLERIEGEQAVAPTDPDTLRWVLRRVTDAEELENFLHQQYLGAKRFSLEGLESFIPLLHRALDVAGEHRVRHALIGMAHRGRLNVLVNIMQKGYSDLFRAFNDADRERFIGRGDVKYHLGYRTRHKSLCGEEVDVALCFNPSHLEFVDPVVVGRARALMDEEGDMTGRCALPICVHGDSAFMGQGIVPETLNLAQLQGYHTGGTLHVVLNNQVGFTTSPNDARSSRYATDIMAFLRVPIFHVNAEDIEAVLRVTTLAVEYRQKFGRDVCIDLIGYRRYGHNEGDEPRFTQPLMYQVIDERPTMRAQIAADLTERGVLSPSDAQEMVEDRRARMMSALQESRENVGNGLDIPEGPRWAPYHGGPESEAADVDTRVPMETLRELLDRITTVPSSIQAHSKLERLYRQRRKPLEEPGASFDWGVGEGLAFASLAAEGYPVRLTGQDARRGTFSHRHAYVTDTRTGVRWTPYSQVERYPNSFQAWDSPLSEAACLGFEYGYSLERPQALVIWEAQFGDFANGAQVIIDQFIASGEDKWGRLTGVALLLPHGFEGQGPEHSYARLGRFLQLCAEDNMRVCDCTTPAQLFHLLRRQVLSAWRKPLVLMTPKSLLRHKGAVSTLEDLSEGRFHRILADDSGTRPDQVRRVLLCSGRIYYDLAEERRKRGAEDVHIVRLEQLYPLHGHELAEVLSVYSSSAELVWVQDEPWNMGAWYFIKARLAAIFGDALRLHCVARAESASPATGSAAAHRYENEQLLEAAFALKAESR